MRHRLRLVGTVLIAAGVLTLIWAAVVWQWQDPFTALYTTSLAIGASSLNSPRSICHRMPIALRLCSSTV